MTLEFAIIFPATLLLLMSVLGVGICSFYQMALDDAVRVAARQAKIGGPASQSGPNFVAAVCAQFARVASNCAASLTYNIQATSPGGSFAAMRPVSVPASGAFANVFPSLAPNANALIQVAYPMPFTLPYIGAAVTFTGTNSLLSVFTIRLEPFA